MIDTTVINKAVGLLQDEFAHGLLEVRVQRTHVEVMLEPGAIKALIMKHPATTRPSSGLPAKRAHVEIDAGGIRFTGYIVEGDA